MVRNRIIGSIHDTMGNLVALESLDLSSNNLSGPILEDLRSLKGLHNLNFSFNDLEGQVPSVECQHVGQLDTWTCVKYMPKTPHGHVVVGSISIGASAHVEQVIKWAVKSGMSNP